MVTWTAAASSAGSGTLWYRFRVRRSGEDYRIVRDYGPVNTLVWTASESEGSYEVEVSARDRAGGRAAVASAVFEMTSRVAAGSDPVLSPTGHPLVFLYSAPPCPAGSSRMRVAVQATDGTIQFTLYQPCSPGRSRNFYLAGLRPNRQYTVRPTVDGGPRPLDGPVLALATPPASPSFPASTVTRRPPSSLPRGLLLQGALVQRPFATDLEGNLVWYYSEPLTFLTEPQPGGLFLAIVQVVGGDASLQLLREFDLAGRTTRETNAARISEQLARLGRRPIDAFHHEALSLPDGNILALASTEQTLIDVQQPGPVAVVGDMILVLDRDLQVLWAWDAFDHLDPRRLATLGETCATLGCPPRHLAGPANDWLHGNSLQPTPDGNILYTVRHQDWVVKIDYRGGAGSGRVLWRLGKDGDFRLDPPDPQLWFAHPHDARFLRQDPSSLILFDNGNVRRAADRSANSRGQVLHLDEPNRLATLRLNADLGAYAFALGAAQKLPHGNYHFHLGWLSDNTSRSVEVDPSGQVVYAMDVATAVYRAFRVESLWSGL